MKCTWLRLVPTVGVVVLFSGASDALAQTAPSLGSADSFAVVGGQTVTNTGPSIVTGNLGLSPGTSVTGFPPGLVVSGTIHIANALAGQAQASVNTAYNALGAQACTTNYGPGNQDVGGLILTPGVYCFASSASITGPLTLDAQGDSSAVFIFKTGSTLITASGSSVLLLNGASECNAFWQVGSSATLGSGSTFLGSILALTSITLTTTAAVTGRTLARNGSVTLDSNTVNAGSCAAAVPTLPQAFLVLLALGVAAAGYFRLRRQHRVA